jgi:hypothetical protein
VRRRRDAEQAQEDEDHRLQYREEAVVRIIKRHSQRQQSPLPSPSDSDSEIVAGRNMLRRRCYGPETSRNSSNFHNSTTMSATSSVVTDLGRISSFNRGPLSSVFTPPATCLSTLTYLTNMYFGHYDLNNYFDPACFPTSLNPSQTQQSKSDTWALYYCMNC